MSDELELRAWRFLAAHRVAPLHVTHVQFIDVPGDESPCRMNAPSFGEYYESARAATWGEAAIGLATALGMPCADDSDSTESASGRGSSSASTATLRNGESESNSPPIKQVQAGSTTAATSAASECEGSADAH